MPRHRLKSLLTLLCALLLPALAAPARADPPGALGPLQLTLLHQMRVAGPSSGAYVYDISAHAPLFGQGSTRSLPPASVQKLYTSTAALLLLGPEARLSTTVLGAGSLEPGGVWRGSLYLRGGGDPTFGSSAFIRTYYGGLGASVQELARQLAARGIKRVEGPILGDESFLDSLRGGPTSAYAQDPEVEGVLSGLAFDRGRVGPEHGAHAPAAYAAAQLRNALRARHIAFSGAVSAAPAPPGAQTLAQASSPTVADLLGLMDRSSDNFFAETLLKDLGALFGGAGSTRSGAAVVRRTLSERFGIHASVVDGSGLSRSDRTTPLAVVTLLNALSGTTIGTVLQADLAVPGRSGTLVHRMRASTAEGRCQAKTGTLNGVSNLAGWCRSLGGHTVAFCFLIGGRSERAAHLIQDRMTIAIARYAP